MALELTLKGKGDKKPKNGGQKNDVMLKIVEFFEKNPILKIIIPAILFILLAAIILFVIFGDGTFFKDDNAGAGNTTPVQASEAVEVLPANYAIKDENILALIEKDPLSEDILASASYTGYVTGSSGLKTALIQIGSEGDTLVVALGETIGDSSWELSEIQNDYVIFQAGKTTKKLTK